mgnify:FL=1
METLTIGDEVLWKGSWGQEPEQVVRVTGIQVNERNGSKEGDPVDFINWDKVTDHNVILDLNNRHWCWAHQITPYYNDADTKLTGDDEPVDIDLIADKYQNGYWE